MRAIMPMTLQQIAEALSTKAHPIDIKQAQIIRRLARDYHALRNNFEGAQDKFGWKMLKQVDQILNTCGVESIRLKMRDGEVRWCSYCNSGDTYNTTVLLWNGKAWIGCWGDLAEKYEDAC